jgi:hypothetical protein
MKNISPVIDMAAQDQAIAQIVTHLRRYDQIALYLWTLMYGRRFCIGERTFVGPRGGEKQCFMNAYTLADPYNIEDMRKRYHLDPGCNPVYVEGWCCDADYFLFEHAWCIDQNGQVIDPTLRGHACCGYFGIPFQWDYVWRTASRTKYYGVINYRNPDLLTTAMEEFLYDPA